MKQKIIISGHSSGIGKALAEHYLNRETAVLGISRRQIEPHDLLQQVCLDLSNGTQLTQWLDGGALEAFIADAQEVVLINNAGMVAPNAVCGRQMPSEIMTAVSLNLTAPLILSNHLLAVKPDDLRVKIVHISSGAGRNAYQGWSVYGATKAALDHHCRCVEAENHRNVRLASIAPGVVDTDMQAEIRSQSAEDFPMLSRFQQLQTNQGLSSPESVAATIAAMIAHEDFGDEIIQDVRHWQALQETFQTASGIHAV